MLVFSDFLYLFFRSRIQFSCRKKLEKENDKSKEEIEESDDDFTNAGNPEADGTETPQKDENSCLEDVFPH